MLEQSGSLVFCRVAAVNKDMDTELTCTCEFAFVATRGWEIVCHFSMLLFCSLDCSVFLGACVRPCPSLRHALAFSPRRACVARIPNHCVVPIIVQKSTQVSKVLSPVRMPACCGILLLLHLSVLTVVCLSGHALFDVATHHGSKKDWMTGQSTFGELHGGKMERCSLLLAKSLTKPNCRCGLDRSRRSTVVSQAGVGSRLISNSREPWFEKQPQRIELRLIDRRSREIEGERGRERHTDGPIERDGDEEEAQVLDRVRLAVENDLTPFARDGLPDHGGVSARHVVLCCRFESHLGLIWFPIPAYRVVLFKLASARCPECSRA